MIFLDPEREIIEHYFHLGYKYDVIINFLRSKHDICMNVRTLKRRLVIQRGKFIFRLTILK